MSIQYKFNEDNTLTVIKSYIDKTYSSHYAGQTQPTELIFSSGRGEDFCVGNIIKYAYRLGKKEGGSSESDTLKIIHYAIMLYSLTKPSA